MAAIFKIITILVAFSFLMLLEPNVFLGKNSVVAQTTDNSDDSEDVDSEAGEDSDNSGQEINAKKTTKDVIKESAQGALNSVIEETIKAIGDSVAKGISESSNNSNNPNSERDVDLNSHDSASQSDNQFQDSPRRARKRITDY